MEQLSASENGTLGIVTIDASILYGRIANARLRLHTAWYNLDNCNDEKEKPKLRAKYNLECGRLEEIESLVDELGLTDYLDDHDFDTELDGAL